MAISLVHGLGDGVLLGLERHAAKEVDGRAELDVVDEFSLEGALPVELDLVAAGLRSLREEGRSVVARLRCEEAKITLDRAERAVLGQIFYRKTDREPAGSAS